MIQVTLQKNIAYIFGTVGRPDFSPYAYWGGNMAICDWIRPLSYLFTEKLYPIHYSDFIVNIILTILICFINDERNIYLTIVIQLWRRKCPQYYFDLRMMAIPIFQYQQLVALKSLYRRITWYINYNLNGNKITA